MNMRFRFSGLGLIVILAVLVTAQPAFSAIHLVINEFVFNHASTDQFEFVELYGDPDTDCSIFTILEIEGDASGAGTIDGIFPAGTTDAAGFWTTSYMSNVIENGTVTLLLVAGFTGSLGDDLDLDNDGVLDVTPWNMIMDDIAVTDGGSADRTYATTTLTKFFDGNPYTPGGASRIPNGVDTDTVADWLRNDFDGEGLPGFTGTPSVGEALNTPGALNEPVTPAGDPVINEFVADHIGIDTHEFVEVFGDADTDYGRFFVIELEGDGTNAGRVDEIIRLGATDGDGIWVTGFMSNHLENGSLTLLLVENFTGYLGQDLDVDNDGTLDSTPWGRLVDDVAVLNGGLSDWVYSAVVLTEGYDGNSFLPGGASRIPNGVDTDAVSDWVRNDYSGEGLPGFIGTPVYGEAYNTPGLVNEPVEDTTPPVIVVDLNRTVLWPPNHKMADICATVTVTDNADPAPVFVLTSVSSSEPDNGNGDGNTTDDIQGDDIGTADLCFQLRAERQGGGCGREYSIVYTATDFSGNSASMTVAVRVPHDHSGWAMAATGFIEDGSAFDDTSDRFAVVIPSKLAVMQSDGRRNLTVIEDGYDATEIDIHHLYVGNANGAIRPLDSETLDANNDGLMDLMVYYSKAGALNLADKLDDKKIGKRTPGGPVGLHYESRDGAEYLVPSIFDLGAPIGLSGDGGVIYGSGHGNAGDSPRSPAEPTIYPNPFNPRTTVSFEITTPGFVSLRVYDIRGQLVTTLKNQPLGPGQHTVEWNGQDRDGNAVASGVYLIRLETPDVQFTRKAVMLK